MLKLLNLGTVAFRQYQKNIFRFPNCIYCSSSLASLSKCSEFNLILLSLLLLKHKTLYKHNFLEYFSKKDLKSLHRLLNDWLRLLNIFIIHFEQLGESSGSLKTINTLESFKSLWSCYILWSHYIISWLLWRTIMFNDGLFISLSQFVAMPQLAF